MTTAASGSPGGWGGHLSGGVQDCVPREGPSILPQPISCLEEHSVFSIFEMGAALSIVGGEGIDGGKLGGIPLPQLIAED